VQSALRRYLLTWRTALPNNSRIAEAEKEMHLRAYQFSPEQRPALVGYAKSKTQQQSVNERSWLAGCRTKVAELPGTPHLRSAVCPCFCITQQEPGRCSRRETVGGGGASPFRLGDLSCSGNLCARLKDSAEAIGTLKSSLLDSRKLGALWHPASQRSRR